MRPMPTASPPIPLMFSKMMAMACAAMAVVPRVDTEDWMASLPNWNMLFSIPDGIPMARIRAIISKSGWIR